MRIENAQTEGAFRHKLQQSDALRSTRRAEAKHSDQSRSETVSKQSAENYKVESVDRKLAEEIVDDLNARSGTRSGLRFHVDESNSEITVQLIDKDSDEVIKSIPGDGLRDFRENFRAHSSAFIDQEA